MKFRNCFEISAQVSIDLATVGPETLARLAMAAKAEMIRQDSINALTPKEAEAVCLGLRIKAAVMVRERLGIGLRKAKEMVDLACGLKAGHSVERMPLEECERMPLEEWLEKKGRRDATITDYVAKDLLVAWRRGDEA